MLALAVLMLTVFTSSAYSESHIYTDQRNNGLETYTIRRADALKDSKPTILGTPPSTVNQGETYYFKPQASDPDGDTLKFSISKQPSWASFNADTGELTGTPGNADVGTHSDIVISVTDSVGLTASLPAFSITVENVDNAPNISGTPATTVQEDTAYYFKPHASDPDGDTLKFSISKQPSWASFNAETGELSGTPGNADVKTHENIVISVTDSTGQTALLPAFSITVENVNDVPTISGTPADSVREGNAYSFTPTEGDIDLPYGDKLTFSIVNKPSWANFDADTGTLSGTPAHADVGTYSGIVITVTDSTGATAQLDSTGATAQLSPFAVSVENLNTAPTISGTPQTSVNQDEFYRFVPTVDGMDTDDMLIFSILNQPSWAYFNPKTGELSGIPGHEDVGIITGIVITVTDNTGLSTSLPSFDIRVINVDKPIPVPLLPPDSLEARAGKDSVRLRWESSASTHLAGYNIYRAASDNGPCLKLPNPREELIKPPTNAPPMPIRTVIIKPPGSFPGIIHLASTPTISPSTIHDKIPMLSSFIFFPNRF